MQQLAGRVAVITGAASGIGAAMAWRFPHAGMKIVAADLDEAALAAACKELAEAGHATAAVRTDVADAAAVEAPLPSIHDKGTSRCPTPYWPVRT